VPPEQIRFEASGMTFAALAWGDPGAPLALCLHGFPDTAWGWRKLAPLLAARGWRVVAPFMRGYAPSDLAPDGAYQIGALARDAIEMHAALGGDERAVLIGHDWGCTAVYAAAAYRPELYARVVAMSIPNGRTLVRELRNPVLGLRQARCSWYMAFNNVPGAAEAALPRLVPRLWRAWSPGYDPTEDLRHFDDAVAGPGRRTAVLRYYRALLQPWARRAAYKSEQARCAGVPKVPTLYLHGREDGCMLPVIGERSGAALSPGSRVEMVQGAGHFLALERPERVAGLIAGFLS
jgi:pimeloyl-ACP methyl ester carboxylesterase